MVDENISSPEANGAVGVLLDMHYQIVSKKTSFSSQETAADKIAQINVYYRDNSGKRDVHHITQYLPYIYADISVQQLATLQQQSEQLDGWVMGWESITKRTYQQGMSIELLKITGARPWETPNIRQILESAHYSVYEADIPFIHRYMIDMDVYGLQKFQILKQKLHKIGTKTLYQPKIMSFDIEIDVEFDPDVITESLSAIIQNASNRITAIGCCWGTDTSNLTTKVFLLEEDDDHTERQFLKEFWQFVWEEIDPDVITTYNGDNFDFPYLLKRMDHLGIPGEMVSPHNNVEAQSPKYGKGWTIPGVLTFDLFKRTKWLYTSDGRKTLNSVAGVVLNKSKIELSESHGVIWRESLESQKSKEQFIEYTKTDAILTYELFFGLGMAEWLEVIKITGAPPREAMFYTQRQAGEFLLFREMFHRDVLIPPTPGTEGKKERDKTRKSAEGGFVFEPTRDIASGVVIADFSSMYPSMMVSHNIGAESFRGIDLPFKLRFNPDPPTTMALMQKKLLKERLRVKAELKRDNLTEDELPQLKRYSWAVKIVANSTIGSYNYTGSRLYNTNISGSVTGLGRTYLQELAELAKSFNPNNDTIYGDTDSVFITLANTKNLDKVWKLSPDKSKKLDKHLPEVGQLLGFLQKNLPEEMRLDLQDVAYRIVFNKGAKKRYSYVSIISKKVTIIGFEAVRHDWSPFAQEVQKFAVHLVLTSGNLKESKQKLIHYLQEQLARPKEELKQEFIKLGPIRRRPSRYKSMTPAVAAFLLFCKQHGLDSEKEWRTYDYFPYLIVKGTDPLYQRSRPAEDVDIGHMDIDYYVQEAINAANRFNLKILVEEVITPNEDLSKYFSVRPQN